ncbi:hypothetical protein PG994_014911 [Apiospora phragmitis]|uniref:Uncharacterized protein n=1 Tax=Apiospora phragmitis TaxID=2905665 RepID=A0ABR1SUZ6_9PEZI
MATENQQPHNHHSHPPQPMARAAAAAAPRPNRTTAAAATASTATVAPSAVRRNLFQSQPTRRPTSTSSTSAETLRMDADTASNTSDIVIRDEHGDFEVGDPPTPPMDEPEAEALDDIQENERERQKLAEVVKHHQINHNRAPAQPEEVMEALRASMRAQVAALSEDSWMYEPEAETLGQ